MTRLLIAFSLLLLTVGCSQAHNGTIIPEMPPVVVMESQPSEITPEPAQPVKTSGEEEATIFPTEELPVYAGLGLDLFDSYISTFEIRFEGDYDWLYTLQTRSTGNTLEQQLHIEGVSKQYHPGDIRFVSDETVNRMIGEGTDRECVQFPADIDIAPAFLTPEDLVDDNILAQMTPVGPENLIGMEAVHFMISDSDMDEWESLNVNLWLGKNNAETLKFAIQGTRSDPLFDAGEGTLNGLFTIRSVNVDFAIEPIPGCELPLPIPEDATDILRLPDMYAFESNMNIEEVSDFFQNALYDEDWLAFDLPQTKDQVTVLSYRKSNRELEINIETTESGVHVEMFVVE